MVVMRGIGVALAALGVFGSRAFTCIDPPPPVQVPPTPQDAGSSGEAQRQVASCGTASAPCCGTDQACQSGLVCNSALVCVPCGAVGAACCHPDDPAGQCVQTGGVLVPECVDSLCQVCDNNSLAQCRSNRDAGMRLTFCGSVARPCGADCPCVPGRRCVAGRCASPTLPVSVCGVPGARCCGGRCGLGTCREGVCR